MSEETIIIPPELVQKAITAVVNSISKNYQKREAIEQALLSKKEPRFQFLDPSNPFHAFYQKRIAEELNGTPKPVPPPVSTQPIPLIQPVKPAQKILPPSFTNKNPPEIGCYKLDIIYLTAQYCALYGQEFAKAILLEQKDSELFSFMRTGQPYFRFFYSLVDQYKLALNPSFLLRKRLEMEASSLLAIKANFEAEAEAENQKIEDQAKEAKDIETTDDVDWTDFKIIATVNYEDATPVPVPYQETETVKRTLHQPKQIMQKSPYTGQLIPAEEFAAHLRYEKKHPQYEKERETMKERRENQNSALANGDQMAQNLANLMKGGPTPNDNQTIWDGREESIPQVVAEKVREMGEKPPARPDLKKPAQVIGPVFPIKK